jgi:hypothetical protein
MSAQLGSREMLRLVDTVQWWWRARSAVLKGRVQAAVVVVVWGEHGA